MALGHFARLPFEIRELVWSNLDFNESILRASSEINQEVWEVYRKFEIKFIISAEEHEEYPSGIVMYDQYKTWPIIHPAYMDFNASDPKLLRRLLSLPYHRPRPIVIELYPPEPQDPGQMVRCWNSAIWLADFFQRSRHEPLGFTVIFKETAETKWSSSFDLNVSIPWPPDANVVMVAKSDLETLIIALSRLMDRNSKFILPLIANPIESGRVHNLIEVSKPENFGRRFGIDYDWERLENGRNWGDEDSDVADLQATWSTWLDYKLDEMLGRTARSMRLERFAFWSPGYQANCLRQFFGKFGCANLGARYSDLRFAVQWAYKQRARAVVAHNPLNFERNSNKSRVDLYPYMPYSPRIRNLPASDLCWIEGGLDKRDGWNRDAWFTQYRRQGIPVSTSAEYHEQLAKYGPLDRVCRDCPVGLICEIGTPWLFKRLPSILCRSYIPETADFTDEDLEDGYGEGGLLAYEPFGYNLGL